MSCREDRCQKEPKGPTPCKRRKRSWGDFASKFVPDFLHNSVPAFCAELFGRHDGCFVHLDSPNKGSLRNNPDTGEFYVGHDEGANTHTMTEESLIEFGKFPLAELVEVDWVDCHGNHKKVEHLRHGYQDLIPESEGQFAGLNVDCKTGDARLTIIDFTASQEADEITAIGYVDEAATDRCENPVRRFVTYKPVTAATTTQADGPIEPAFLRRDCKTGELNPTVYSAVSEDKAVDGDSRILVGSFTEGIGCSGEPTRFYDFGYANFSSVIRGFFQGDSEPIENDCYGMGERFAVKGVEIDKETTQLKILSAPSPQYVRLCENTGFIPVNQSVASGEATSFGNQCYNIDNPSDCQCAVPVGATIKFSVVIHQTPSTSGNLNFYVNEILVNSMPYSSLDNEGRHTITWDYQITQPIEADGVLNLKTRLEWRELDDNSPDGSTKIECYSTALSGGFLSILEACDEDPCDDSVAEFDKGALASFTATEFTSPEGIACGSSECIQLPDANFGQGLFYSFTFENETSEDITDISVSSSDAAWSVSTDGTTAASGESFTGSVGVIPTSAAGDYETNVSLSYKGGGEDHSCTFRVCGTILEEVTTEFGPSGFNCFDTCSVANGTDFGSVSIATTNQFTFTNSGTTTITGLSVASSDPNFSATISPSSVDGGNSAILSVTFDPASLADGAYGSSIQVIWDDGGCGVNVCATVGEQTTDPIPVPSADARVFSPWTSDTDPCPNYGAGIRTPGQIGASGWEDGSGNSVPEGSGVVCTGSITIPSGLSSADHVIVEMRYRDAPLDFFTDDSLFLRDGNGDLIKGWVDTGSTPNVQYYLIDWKNQTFIDNFVARACELVDKGGVTAFLLDWMNATDTTAPAGYQTPADKLPLIQALAAKGVNLWANVNDSTFDASIEQYFQGAYHEIPNNALGNQTQFNNLIDILCQDWDNGIIPAIELQDFGTDNAPLSELAAGLAYIFNGYFLFAEDNATPGPEHSHDCSENTGYPQLGNPTGPFTKNTNGTITRQFDGGLLTVNYNEGSIGISIT